MNIRFAVANYLSCVSLLFWQKRGGGGWYVLDSWLQLKLVFISVQFGEWVLKRLGRREKVCHFCTKEDVSLGNTTGEHVAALWRLSLFLLLQSHALH